MDFLNLPVDFASVRMHAQSFRVLQSDDDKVVPLAEAEVLAMGLHAPLVTLHKKGHFDEESGITECHPILDAVLSLVEE